MQFTQSRSQALPPSGAVPYPPEPAAHLAGRGSASLNPIRSAAPGLSGTTPIDCTRLQAEWDRAGLIRRLRIIATTPVLAREFLILPALLLAGLAILPLIAAVLP